MIKVIISTSDLLLGEGIRELLIKDKHNHLEIYLIKNFLALDKDIRQIRPNIIIIDEFVKPENLSFVMEKFHDSDDLSMLIILNLEENNLLLYKKEKRDISSMDALLSVIPNSEIYSS